MDITTDSSSRNIKKLYPTWGKILILTTVVVSIISVIVFGLRTGIISLSLVLISIGVVSVHSWNRELKNDGYASLSQLYTSYLGSIFLLVALCPILVITAGILSGIAISVIVVLLYVFSLSYVAFRGVDSYETQAETYHGPAVVYIDGGPYTEHIEQVAKEKRKPTD